MKGLTDTEVTAEIAELKKSEYVRLARLEQRMKYRERQVLYTLRALDKRGRKLAAAGITDDILRDIDDIEFLGDF